MILYNNIKKIIYDYIQYDILRYIDLKKYNISLYEVNDIEDKYIFYEYNKRKFIYHFDNNFYYYITSRKKDMLFINNYNNYLFK